MNDSLKGLPPLKPDDLKYMRVKDGALYWKGAKLKADTAFSPAQRIWIGISAAAGIVGALVSFTKEAIDVNKEICWYPTETCAAKSIAKTAVPAAQAPTLIDKSQGTEKPNAPSSN
jgi:hypothetical protein